MTKDRRSIPDAVICMRVVQINSSFVKRFICETLRALKINAFLLRLSTPSDQVIIKEIC